MSNIYADAYPFPKLFKNLPEAYSYLTMYEEGDLWLVYEDDYFYVGRLDNDTNEVDYKSTWFNPNFPPADLLPKNIHSIIANNIEKHKNELVVIKKLMNQYVLTLSAG